MFPSECFLGIYKFYVYELYCYTDTTLINWELLNFIFMNGLFLCETHKLSDQEVPGIQ